MSGAREAWGTAGSAIPPGEAIGELIRRVEAGEDPRDVLQAALEVYQGPNTLPPSPVLGPADANDFAAMGERSHTRRERVREYFFPVGGPYSERRPR